MLFSKDTVPHGHDLLDELHQHVEDFHTGLADIEGRMIQRAGAVRDRLMSLEEEHADLSSGLHRITRLRKEGEHNG